MEIALVIAAEVTLGVALLVCVYLVRLMGAQVRETNAQMLRGEFLKANPQYGVELLLAEQAGIRRPAHTDGRSLADALVAGRAMAGMPVMPTAAQIPEPSFTANPLGIPHGVDMADESGDGIVNLEDVWGSPEPVEAKLTSSSD